MRALRPVCAVVGTTVGSVVLLGCASGDGPGRAEPASDATTTTARAGRTAPAPTTATPGATSPTASTSPQPPAAEPRTSYLSVPALGLRDLAVVRYRGTTDDAPGTDIQNTGKAASPRGPRGGVGPGEVGNHLVTGHRTSHGAPFADLPELRDGARIRVRSGGQTFVYRVTHTREVSFRSAASLRAQRAAVPGRPGVAPTRAMITLSTCATPEDHAEGNYWSDELGNPEHRIDKVGVLVDTG